MVAIAGEGRAIHGNASEWRSPELASASILSLAVPFLLLLPITHDAVWQMWVARQMIHGTTLYSQIVEVNPPLWFWIAMPLAAMAETMSIGGRVILLGFFVLLLFASFSLTALLIRDCPANRRAAVYTGFVLATVLLSLPMFTQREHFALIAAFPYVTLIARREAGLTVGRGLAVAIGLFGAAGFAIKPFFALVPIALELWAWKQARRVRTETTVLAIAAVLYGAAALLLAPGYFSEAVPLVAATYAYFTASSPAGFVMPLLIFGIAALPIAGRHEAAPFVVAALAFLLAFVVQGKGWGYHALPALGMLLVALCLSFRRSILRDALAAAAIGLMLLGNARFYQPDRRLAAVIDAPRGTTVAILSVSTRPLWPLMEERGYRWPLRYFSLWTLPAIVEGVQGADAFASELRSHVSQDLRCAPPDILVIDREAGLDIPRYLAADPGLRQLLAAYRLQRQVDELAMMIRVRPPPPRPENCRKIY